MQASISDAVVKGVLVGLFMAISVGPTLFAVIKYSLSHGYKAGWAFILGVSVSDIIYVTLANVAAAWLSYLAPYEKHIAIGGSVILMIMGITSFLKKQTPAQNAGDNINISSSDFFKIWLGGFLLNSLNPGVLITWLGAVTLTAAKPGLYRFFLFGTCLAIILSIDFSKVFLADKIKGFLTPRRITLVNRFSAICLFSIGLVLMIGTLVNMQSKKTNEKNQIDQILSK